MRESAALRCMWLCLLTIACDDSPADSLLVEPLDHDTLLSQPHGMRYECTAAPSVTPLAKPSFQPDSLLVQRAAGTFLIAPQLDDSLGQLAQHLTITPFDELGVHGEERTLSELEGWFANFSSAERDDQLVVVWKETTTHDVTRLRMVTLDQGAALVDEPHVLADVQSNIGYVLTAPADVGFALLWTEREGPFASRLFFARFDPSGSRITTPRELARDEYGIRLHNFVRFGDGYVASYDENSKANGYLVLLDADGKPRKAPFTLGPGAEAWSFLVREDEILFAYTFSGVPYAGADATYELRLARFGLDGEIIGQVRALDRAIADHFISNATLLVFGDDVGVVWSAGSVQMGPCGGCQPDNSLKFAIVSGGDPEATSNVLELLNPLSSGGLLGTQGRWTDGDLLVLAEVQFHATGQLAMANIHCEATAGE